MGMPLPPGPIEYGINCVDGETSTPPLWAVDETPKYIYAMFAGIELCPLKNWPAEGSVNGKLFKLPQIMACTWRQNFNNVLVQFTIGKLIPQAWRTNLSISHIDGRLWFAGSEDNPIRAATSFGNELECADPGRQAHSGAGSAFWSPGPRKVAIDYNFMKHANTMAEVLPIDKQFQVYKFCNVPMHSNVKVLFDSDYDPYQNELESFPTPWPDFQDQNG